MAGKASAEALIEKSIEFLNQNQAAQAEAAVREALAMDSRNPRGWNTLGYSLHVQAKYRESEQAYLEMTDLEPSEAMHWMNVGTARRNDDRIDEALYAFARAAALGAATPDFYYNVALAHIAREDYESALSLLEQALQLNPADAEIRYRYALCCYETLRTDEALAALQGWNAVTGDASDLAASAGQLMMKLGDVESAEPTVRQAAAQPDADPQAKLTLIQLLERTNRLTEARALLDELQISPGAIVLGGELKLTQAQLAQREAKHALAAALFREAVDGCAELHNKHFQQFPLAKSLDALGRFEEAFQVLSDAHRSQVAHLKRTAPLAVLRGAPTLSIADHHCDPRDVAAWDQSNAPSLEQSPIFIVAFPRSGTTLLEVSLDAHPMLKSMDEQPFLQNALDDMLEQGIRYPIDLAKLTQVQLADIRASYWFRVGRRINLEPQQRLIDKNPLNLLRLPVIRRLFPHAKILLAVRHPCDVILSCFMQHFRAPDFALLCVDIPTLARAYRHAFDFWYSQQALLQARVHEIRYESLVEDFDGHIRRVFDFLELPWDDAALSPATRAREKRFISTPSYSQVVQPVTSKAVGRWHGYRSHFESSLPVLQPYFERWDYAF
jgi:Flp pilus assembly protein TadD